MVNNLAQEKRRPRQGATSRKDVSFNVLRRYSEEQRSSRHKIT
jgi:hypothetical protein